MSGELLPAVPGGEFILYQTEDGRTRLEVRFKDETVWLSLNQMAELFQRDKSVISRHIKNIFDERELMRSSVVAESATTAADGKTYQVEFYNLDERAILPDSGKVSREEAHHRAEEEYERFAARRRYELEAQGEADLLGQLDAEVKKLPKRKGGRK